MSKLKINIINQCIETLPFVTLTSPFELEEILLKGEVEIDFDELDKPLSFEVDIYPQYPFRFHNEETIKFSNKNLLEFKHVMGNGMICIHTSHNVNLKEKLITDFNSLKNWIIKYYINRDDDIHYEHIIVPEHTIKDEKYSYMFTELNYEFKKYDYGYVNLSKIIDGRVGDNKNNNYIIQNFTNRHKVKVASCKWSSYYKNLLSKPLYNGIYVFLEQPPAIYNRLAFNNWKQLKSLFRQNFIEFLHAYQKECKNKDLGDSVIPLFIGYNISNVEIHWQVILLETGKFPIKGIREKNKVHTELINRKITWGVTQNSSYAYFFGRGAFSKKITTKKILILGTGAIGSIVSRSLTRGGCSTIDLCDYDIKKPENACRSEFEFSSGISDKVEELGELLFRISPFIEIQRFNHIYLEKVSKMEFDKSESQEELGNFLNSYDIVFDCTTDNDLMYILNQLKLSCDLINMSITNKAKEFICAFYPNMYGFVTKQIEELIEQDTEDMHNPTGCWSPTFKASYNDINVLVQYALKHINLRYEHDLPKNNFVIETGSETDFKLELKEF